MTTALQMIKVAARRTGFLAAGETLGPDDAADALDVMNTMLDAGSTNRLLVYQIVQEALAMVANQANYTIGSSGTWNTTRPVRLDDSSFIRISNVDYPLQLIGVDAYANQAMKATTALVPYLIAYDAAYPLGTVYLYPTPTTTDSVYLRSWKALQSFASLTTDLSLPPGYRRYIEWNLAKELCTEYGRPVTADILREATNSRAAIATINAPNLMMKNESGYNRFRRVASNIYQG